MKLEHIRAQFPALALTDDGRRRIYLDNPAGTQVPHQVVEAVTSCLTRANANVGGTFVTSRAADEIVAGAHAAMADLLNAPDRAGIVFGANMTTLTFQISRSLGLLFASGEEIIVTEMDHDANVTPWTMLASDRGLTVHKVRIDKQRFTLDLDHFEQLLSERTALVCVGLSSNLLGTINDVRHICKLAHEYGALVFVDAVHAVPHIPVDVQTLGCDLLACSPYKFFGPHQGVLWARTDLLDQLHAYKVRPAPDSGPGRFETGTQNHEAMAGVSAAVDYLATLADGAEAGTRRERLNLAMHAICEYERDLCRALLDGLAGVPGLQVHGIGPERLAERVPTVSFTIDGIAPATVAAELGKRNIFAWSGHSYAVEPCRALGLLERGGVLRVGLVHYNGHDDIEVLVEALHGITAR